MTSLKYDERCKRLRSATTELEDRNLVYKYYSYQRDKYLQLSKTSIVLIVMIAAFASSMWLYSRILTSSDARDARVIVIAIISSCSVSYIYGWLLYRDWAINKSKRYSNGLTDLELTYGSSWETPDTTYPLTSAEYAAARQYVSRWRII